MKLEDVENVFTKNTKVVLMVHTYGLTAEAEEIENFCKEKGIYLIEDLRKHMGRHITIGYVGHLEIYQQ